MRDPNNAFHIAIPCKDLQEALDFYEGKLGFENKRRYDDRVTFNMFGDQFDKNVIGLNSNDSKSFTIDYESSFQNKDIAGKSVDFDITLNSIQSKTLPDFNNELLASCHR